MYLNIDLWKSVFWGIAWWGINVYSGSTRGNSTYYPGALKRAPEIPRRNGVTQRNRHFWFLKITPLWKIQECFFSHTYDFQIRRTDYTNLLCHFCCVGYCVDFILWEFVLLHILLCWGRFLKLWNTQFWIELSCLLNTGAEGRKTVGTTSYTWWITGTSHYQLMSATD